MSALGVAVWGLGPHAVRKIVPALASTEGLRLVGVLSRNQVAVDACVAQYGCRGWVDDAAMLADPAVDAVYIATPSGLHAEHAGRVLHAGRHAWVEKPAVMRREEAVRLAEQSRTVSRSFCEGFMYLFHPQFLDLQAGIRDGRIGRPLSVTCRFGIPALSAPGFRTDPAMGGSALYDVGSYTVSAVLALFPEAAASVVSRVVSRRPGSAVDTSGHAIMRMDEVDVHLEWRTESAYRNEIFVWGEGGSVSTDLIFSKPADHVPVLQWRDAHGTPTDTRAAAANHFVEMLRTFGRWATDGVAADAERARVVRRAEVLESIGVRSN